MSSDYEEADLLKRARKNIPALKTKLDAILSSTTNNDSSAANTDPVAVLVNKLCATGHICTEKRIIDVSYNAGYLDPDDDEPTIRPICTLYLDDKYLEFYDEFDQIGINVPGMKEFFRDSGWKISHS